jgi:putative ABC transport system permease protein
MTIVGVVSDVKERALDTATLPHTYEPYEQHRGAPNSLNVAIRTQGNPQSAATLLRGAVWGLDRQLAVAQLRTMDEVISESMSARRFNLSLIAAFTVLAMALAIIGIYGVMGYSVAERTHEIGIRMALGATGGRVMLRVIIEAIVIAISGIGIGLCGTVAVARVLSRLLYGVSATDPMTLVIVCATILGASIAASYVPARRAMAVDPMVALRHE